MTRCWGFDDHPVVETMELSKIYTSLDLEIFPKGARIQLQTITEPKPTNVPINLRYRLVWPITLGKLAFGSLLDPIGTAELVLLDLQYTCFATPSDIGPIVASPFASVIQYRL